MIRIMMSGHGELSLGMLDAFKMIYGEDPNVVAIPFERGEGTPQLIDKFALNDVGRSAQDSLLILVDIFGGTPYNAACQYVMKKENCDVVSGLSLPLLLEAASLSHGPLTDAVAQLHQIGQQSVHSFREETEAMVFHQEDEEELL